MVADLAVGLDIGTTSVKAVAADADGVVVARSRVPHRLVIPSPGRFEHDVDEAWTRGPIAALDALGLDEPPVGVSVAAMVPSLAGVDATGHALTPGLLYGDERGREGTAAGADPASSGELVAFARALAAAAPDAAGLWPAQAVANFALGGEAVLDTSTAATAFPLFDWTGWDPRVASDAGARVEQLPRLVPTAWECGRVTSFGRTDPSSAPVLASGCIDALAEQIVAGADHEGDVLVILGTTLIVWCATPSADAIPAHFVIPHTASGLYLAGGPSDAGGLFLEWVRRLLGGSDASDAWAGARETPTARALLDPRRVPVWAPYPRGERVPLHDRVRRAALTDLDLTHDAAALRRAAFEASGFAARRMIDAVRAAHSFVPRRIVATGGGTRVAGWVQALADATSLAVECVAVPEGGALGSAFLARCAAGREPEGMLAARRWARTGRTFEPDPRWVDATTERYDRFLTVAG